MHERPAPEVTVRGHAGGPVVEVISSGGHDDRPRGRRRGAALAAGLAALALAEVASTQQRSDPAPATPKPSDLALVETGAALSMQWGYGGRLDVSLPLLIRNDGGPVTISSVALEGTSLAQPAVDVAVVPGGRLPVTLRQVMSCPAGASVPADAALRLDVVRDERPETRRLLLPDGVVERVAGALRDQCSAVPIDQAVVLRSAELGQDGETVQLRVEASNISADAVQLTSVEPATGLDVTLAPDPESPAADLPIAVAKQPVVFRLVVSVADCAAAPPADSLETSGIADVTYDDGRGSRAAKAVTGDLPLLRALLESPC